MKPKRPEQRQINVEEIARTLRETKTEFAREPAVRPKKPIFSDVLGSYTGMTQDDDTPVQDADDL